MYESTNVFFYHNIQCFGEVRKLVATLYQTQLWQGINLYTGIMGCLIKEDDQSLLIQMNVTRTAIIWGGMQTCSNLVSNKIVAR